MDNLIVVSRKKALAANELGIEVLQTAFLPKKKHNTYRIVTEGLTDEIIVALGGELPVERAAPETTPTGRLKRNQTTRRSSVTRDALLEVTAVERVYTPDSRRAAVYDVLRTLVGQRIIRETLVEFIVARTQFGYEIIDPALSHFIHETGIISVVE